MSDLIPVKRALISVSDKGGLAEFASALVNEFGVALLSTGGTAKFLRDAGLAVTDVSEITGFPEMMDGRVKTLHPKIHGGLLALRDDAAHVKSMIEHGIEPIDLVCINLYPFQQTIDKPGVTFDEAIENIDIGGPSMVRSAAKNHRFVAVVTSPDQYDKILGDLRQHNGSTCGKHRLKLAQKAFDHTARYDAAIAGYLMAPAYGKSAEPAPAGELPDEIRLTLKKKQSLRYGENPHQKAALYSADEATASASVVQASQLHGKELSYINLLDADAALAAVTDLQSPAACIVKHATPCGFAGGDDIATAFVKAYDSDPVAAFGGIVAVNRVIDLHAAQKIVEGQKFLEVIVAPGYAPEALELLKQRWKNCRLLECGMGFQPMIHGLEARATKYSMHKIAGGMLVQAADDIGIIETEWKVVSARQPTDQELTDLKLAWIAVKHVKSNAIVIAKSGATIGIGGGQVDRVGASRIAIEKAGPRAIGAVAASDAFFPFPDGPQLLLDAGVTAIIQPGGSVRDQETIDLVNQRNATMIVTGRRHFRH
ncbi:MAG: bifunctional phosphoribosylaminoimidazolecarboxamide formyltransferase/IMP cyclohydrolase [Burkholderiales bacterium]|nr:bifunctional phosphoribosylaminoimidazolecarboxamide formyltransferase/IMP cyclohydrolase [Phycisphaerae bacterium]